MGASEIIPNTTKPLNNNNIHTPNLNYNSIPCSNYNYSVFSDEWFHKFSFLVSLLRKEPHKIILKDSLRKEREKLSGKLKIFLVERNLVHNSICANKLNKPEESNGNVLESQIKHLDLMCLTLERQIDVLSHVDQMLPPTDHLYTGEPDSLDGTSSEITLPSLPPNKNNIVRIGSVDPLLLLHVERTAHRETTQELLRLKRNYDVLREEFDSGEGMSTTSSSLTHLEEDDIFGANRNDEVNKDLLNPFAFYKRSHIDNDSRSTLRHNSETKREIERLHLTLSQLEKVKTELSAQNQSLKTKLSDLSTRISQSTPHKNKTIKNESSSEVESDESKLRRKSTYKVPHPNSDKSVAQIKELSLLIHELQSKEEEQSKIIMDLREENRKLRSEEEARSKIEEGKIKGFEEEQTKIIKDLREENRKLRSEEEVRSKIEEGKIRGLEEELENLAQKLSATEQCFLTRDEEYGALRLDLDTLNEENKRLKDELNILHHKVEKEQSKSLERIERYERELGSILEENKTLKEDFNRERILRKRYFNIVEELKGKIRVYCRIRPLHPPMEKQGSGVIQTTDPFTVQIETMRGLKEFQFDRVFLPHETQEQVFIDTKNLIQSAFDGYNVCCVSYGQTGSGKTYTILGDDENPGLAPRTFTEIFSVAHEMSQTYSTTISFYILELYNDKLIDLLNPSGNPFDSPDPNKLEIKRDRRGTVWVSGARILVADSSLSLEKSFRQALGFRHTAATKMNDRSSRSHLIIGLIIETTSKVNGTVLRGKISLLDLAGSERTGKSGVSAETLREANAINKSLSALGDVINALNTDQPFVPYRNNKLTLLMQDSIGGNAKTLMFVNISPSLVNLDETLTSLTYATRVKQVTNGATKNSETREITRLRNIISKMKRGENCSVDEIDTL